MDAMTQAHISSRFIRRSRVTRHGIGLSTVYGIVKQSGGYIWVYSEVGQGSTFKVYLPRIEEAVETPRRSEKPATRKGTETILLVEDEKLCAS